MAGASPRPELRPQGLRGGGATDRFEVQTSRGNHFGGVTEMVGRHERAKQPWRRRPCGGLGASRNHFGGFTEMVGRNERTKPPWREVRAAA
jgi:hypothetical protein